MSWFFPIALTYYITRALEGDNWLFFLLGGAVIIGLLIWRKPPHWKVWAILTGIGAIILAIIAEAAGGRNRRF